MSFEPIWKDVTKCEIVKLLQLCTMYMDFMFNIIYGVILKAFVLAPLYARLATKPLFFVEKKRKIIFIRIKMVR